MDGDPFPARTPCLFDGCHLSAEEHHRLHHGALAELAALRGRLRAPEALDLSAATDEELLAEVGRRLSSAGR